MLKKNYTLETCFLRRYCRRSVANFIRTHSIFIYWTSLVMKMHTIFSTTHEIDNAQRPLTMISLSFSLSISYLSYPMRDSLTFVRKLFVGLKSVASQNWYRYSSNYVQKLTFWNPHDFDNDLNHHKFKRRVHASESRERWEALSMTSLRSMHCAARGAYDWKSSLDNKKQWALKARRIIARLRNHVTRTSPAKEAKSHMLQYFKSLNTYRYMYIMCFCLQRDSFVYSFLRGHATTLDMSGVHSGDVLKGGFVESAFGPDSAWTGLCGGK